MHAHRPLPFTATLDDDHERRQHEHDTNEEDQDSAPRQKTELRHSSEVRGQKRVERGRGRERANDDAGQCVSHERPHGFGHRRAAISFVDVALVEHGHEVDAQSGQ
jgi:hypothetical protein